MELMGQIDEHIRSGRGSSARKLLRGLLVRKLAREEKVVIAALLRRTNLHAVALSLLNPIVRPKGKRSYQATPEEMAEYAASLTYIGASEEALGLLQKLQGEEIPQSYLFRAFALFTSWNYNEAIPLLQKYIQSTKITDYQRLVGKVNLLASFVYERSSVEADSLIQEILTQTEKEQFTLLRGNVLELASQNFIFSRKWKEAKETLEQGRKLLSFMPGLDSFFIEKWSVLLNFLSSQHKRKALNEIFRIKELARSKQHWETLRDCDRIVAIELKDEALLNYVYFGSPSQSFRDRLLKDFGLKQLKDSSFIWKLGGADPHSPELDLSTGKMKGSDFRLKPGFATQRLLLALAQDFYRPMRVAVLHHTLFPKEFYNPTTSPPKIYEKVRLLRKEMICKRVPLEIIEKSGFYYLKSPEGIQIRKSVLPLIEGREQFIFQKILSQFGGDAFGRTDLAQRLELSQRTANRFILNGLSKGILTKLGAGPNTRYLVQKNKLG